MKIWIAAIAMISLAGLVSADEIQDSYAKLKAAVASKNAEQVKTSAAQTQRLARALVNAPKPAAADQVSDWQQQVDYGKEVEGYTEYALAVTAQQSSQPAETVALVDMLLAQNAKSKYVDLCAPAYLAALGKTGGSAKQLEGMAKVAAGRPDNEVALGALAEGYASKSPDRALGYANKLVSSLKTKAKPDGVAEADWQRSKNAGLATGYYIAGMINGSKQSWVDCDRDLRAALPLISGDKARLGGAYFYLGLANYQYGKLIRDRSRMQQGLKYSQESAAIPGPMQASAYRNVNAIQAELNGARR